ncbi:unnamed protein product [Mytilus coruscus]|uniref:C2H2-type domain-containing protein n=1 Tax=Mytilus coruscus TaxID=42192 RepID=A0A6J8B6K6_MYTCO|nr:unnamed protein product [Mytilus coruscus]
MCIRCRNRVVTDILVNHILVARTPYYCIICQFRCTNLNTLQQHVNFHRPHQTLKAGLQESLPDQDYFLVSESPYCPEVGGDFRVLPRQRPGLGTIVDPVLVFRKQHWWNISFNLNSIPKRPVGQATVYVPSFIYASIRTIPALQFQPTFRYLVITSTSI